MQIERRNVKLCLNVYAEMQLVLSKYNANRAQKRQTLFERLCRDADVYAEMQLVLSKYNANRAQKRQTCLNVYAEMQLDACSQPEKSFQIGPDFFQEAFHCVRILMRHNFF